MDGRHRETRNVTHDFSAARLFELHPLFVDLVEHPLLVRIARAVLGDDCHLIAQNVLRTDPGQVPFTHDFHIDEPLLFPVPDHIDRHPPTSLMPVFWLVVHIALCDVDEVEKGPTAYVPGSHFSGRRPAAADRDPRFDGRPAEPVLVRSGDAYLHNSQCWHAALPNRSSQPRHLLQVVYGARFVGHWFRPYIDYRLPRSIADAPERDRVLWGLYEGGPYS